MSDFVSFHTALSGLRAAQAGLAVTADNVANAGTPGRTRQRVDLVSGPAHLLPVGQIGSGVTIDGISRVRSEFLDLQVREGSAALGRLDARADVLYRLESLMVEPTVGIADGLAGVWGAFEDLANDPANGGTREAVIGALDNLVERIRNAAAGIDTVVDHTRVEMRAGVDEVNELLRQTAQLNQQIFAAGVDQTVPNDLLDRRDVILDRLAELASVRVVEMSNGMLRVSSNGIALVSENVAISLQLGADGVSLSTPGGLELAPGGMLGGLQRSLRDDVPAHQEQLDAFARDLAGALNTTHALGFTPSGSPGGDLLSYDPSRAAATLQTVVSDRAAIAAARDPGAGPFDGANAQQIGELRFVMVGAGGTATLDEQYRNLISTLGAQTSAALSAADSQAALVSASRTQRLNANGVSVDEEMVSLMHYQRSYEAAARVLTVIDETMDLLVNRLGIVGR